MRLMKFFPLSYKLTIWISILLYVALALVLGVPLGMVSILVQSNTFFGLFMRFLMGIIASLVEIYSVSGIIISILHHFKKI